jgi:hypothetical protein
VYGIILDNIENSIKYSKEAKLNFNVYVPIEIEKFKKEMKLNTPYSQTIYYRGKIQNIFIGEINSENVMEILDKVNNE